MTVPLPKLTDPAILVRSMMPRISTPDGLTLRQIRAANVSTGLTWPQVVEALDELVLHRFIRINSSRIYWWENDPNAPAGYYDRGPYVPVEWLTRLSATTEATPVD